MHKFYDGRTVYGVCLTVLFGIALAPAQGSSPHPDIIMIVTDDQGYGDLGVTGNPLIKTPQLDRLARESAWMTNYCVSPVCALTWMKERQDAHKPFFCYIATNAPHGPFNDVPPRLYQTYKKMNLANDRFPQEKGHAVEGTADTDRRARIFAMITNIDDNIGKLLQHLDRWGIAENTIVLFMVDNGPNGRRYVAGMRGMKETAQ